MRRTRGRIAVAAVLGVAILALVVVTLPGTAPAPAHSGPPRHDVTALTALTSSWTIGSPGAGASPAAVRSIRASRAHPAARVQSTSASTTGPSGTLTETVASLAKGATITFSYTATPATPKNWIGIYEEGQTPGAEASTTYQYAPDASGTVTFSTASLTPGTWVAYLLYDTGYEVMAGPITFSVTGTSTGPSGTLTDNGDTFVQGSIVTFTYTATPATAKNWIGVYEPGQTPGVVGSTIWQYAPAASGTASFSTASLTPGSWVAYLFYDTGYGVMAGPIAFSVSAPPAAPSSTMPVYTGQLGQGRLNGPFGISLDAKGDVWVADTYGNQVVELSPDGAVERVIGSEGSSPGQLDGPESVALDDAGQVFVADTGNNRVEEYSTTGQFVATIGGPGAGDGEFDQPEGVAVSGSTLYVADTGNNRVEEFSTTGGTYLGQITEGMSGPQGLAVDDAGDLWVAQNGIYTSSDDSVTEYGPTGVEVFSIGTNTSDFGGMSNPADVAVDGAGDIYVTEPDYDLVQEFTQYGQYLGEFGTPGDGGTRTPASEQGLLDFPVGVVTLPDGHVLVADSGNDRIASFGTAPTPSSPPAPFPSPRKKTDPS